MMNADKAKILIGMSNTMLFSRSVANGTWDMGVVFYVASLLFIVGTTACCKKQENMWLYALNVVGSTPINITITKQIMMLDIFNSGVPVIGDVIAYVEIYLIVLSIEQLLLGIIGRIIWKEQQCVEEDAEWAEELY